MIGSNSTFGGGIRFGPGVPVPRVVKLLLIINVALFFLPALLGIRQEDLIQQFGLVPGEVFLGGKIWQLFTYMFLHGSFFHVAFNMLMLWMFGSSVEHAWGSRDFSIYYTICGVGAALTQWGVDLIWNSSAPMIGASGAVYGLMLAYALMYPDRIIMLGLIFPMKMRYFIWLLVGISLVSGLGRRAGDSVAHFAHLGGVLFGWLYLKQDWRASAATRRLRGIWAREKMRQNARQAERREEHATSVDEILDKITTQGIDSLTERERRILRESSRH
jgi:membrane associated rhomboid family serine protease